ncbi:PTS system mannose/fructose/sorbose family transporter subunit IID [Brevibacillus fluminis]|uniref:PTS system mannose/fructose/sorbose family transporter subunit IID n=1 Tax=Brevibacillus fluminis TaxID=511487 RepID=A0A3M8DQI9_9BACL|nr:PTS system mannose/fructose/sorbose family transporter subunit IID [Brevibacillus fluminis]RNB90390.1 PTS system mannose/fructose/sorbose family transporter subunit IID [Brevibacillus fluminis]
MSKSEDNVIGKKELLKVFFRSLMLQGSWNFERMQALGFAYAMIPILKKLYKTKEELTAGIKRHLEFFNTAPWMGGFIMGVSTAMEEQNARDKSFNPDSINAVKAGLMGPLAGIGDTFFWGTFRVIAAAVGASLTSKGNAIGLLFYILLFNIPHYLVRYQGVMLGYRAGIKYLSTAAASGITQKITKGASIVGLMAVGAMTATMVEFKTPMVIEISGAKVEMQSVLDKILPSLLPLMLTLIVFYLVKQKQVKVVYLLIGLILFGVVGKVIGLL